MSLTDINTTSVVPDEVRAMSYEKLDQIYPESILIKDGEYKTRIGGVFRPWASFNTIDPEQPPKIKDSNTFANVSSDYGVSTKFIESSWKIHLSIQPDDLGKAWDIIYPLLCSHKVPNFKTSRLTVSRILYTQMQGATLEFLENKQLSLEDKNQALQDLVRVYNGMQITIYIEKGKEREYNEILQEIEPLLYKAGINPGIIDKSDRALGIYSSVRHVGKSYTSHDKVTGYKSVNVKDIFEEIKPKFTAVHFNWNQLDYTNHILKAKLTMQQVVDAKRKYELAIISKPEFIQSCDVATEYFERWHRLISKTSDKSKLSITNEIAFTKFKKWIDNGYKLIPTIRKDNIKKYKEAEDILLSSTETYTSFEIPKQRIQRSAAHRNLLSLLPRSFNLIDKIKVSDSKKEEQLKHSIQVLQKLSEHRKKTFSTLKSFSLPNIEAITPVQGEVDKKQITKTKEHTKPVIEEPRELKAQSLPMPKAKISPTAEVDLRQVFKTKDHAKSATEETPELTVQSVSISVVDALPTAEVEQIQVVKAKETTIPAIEEIPELGVQSVPMSAVSTTLVVDQKQAVKSKETTKTAIEATQEIRVQSVPMSAVSTTPVAEVDQEQAITAKEYKKPAIEETQKLKGRSVPKSNAGEIRKFQTLFDHRNTQFKLEQNSNKYKPGFFETHFWRFWAGLSGGTFGLVGGVVLSFFLAPLTAGISWLAVLPACVLFGAGVGYLVGDFMEPAHDDVLPHSLDLNSRPLLNTSEPDASIDNQRTSRRISADSLLESRKNADVKWGPGMYSPRKVGSDEVENDRDEQQFTKYMGNL